MDNIIFFAICALGYYLWVGSEIRYKLHIAFASFEAWKRQHPGLVPDHPAAEYRLGELCDLMDQARYFPSLRYFKMRKVVAIWIQEASKYEQENQ